MNNYFPSPSFINDLSNFLVSIDSHSCSSNSPCISTSGISSNSPCISTSGISSNSPCISTSGISSNSPCISTSGISSNSPCISTSGISSNCRVFNNWYKHFHEHLSSSFNSVNIIDKLNNDQYDDLLTKNIIFINLVDASAVNTVIECIVRNCPIIVNNHPAVVEMLGSKYPLYYNGNNTNFNEDIVKLLLDPNNIKKANDYLKRLDKTKFTIDYFIKQFSSIIKAL